MIDWTKVAAASGDPEATWNDGALAMLQEYDRQRAAEMVTVDFAHPAVARERDRARMGDPLPIELLHDLVHRQPELAPIAQGRAPHTSPLARAVLENALRAGRGTEAALVAALVAVDVARAELAVPR